MLDKSFTDLDKFPICYKKDCLMPLEIQNRFKCFKCLHIFCAKHRLIFNHDCNLIENNIHNLINKTHDLCYMIHCNCRLTEINRYRCNKCNKEYCISHRLDFDHNCKTIINNHQMI